MDISIVIPTKNGGIQLGVVLDAIFSQETDMTYEVICVDSGSTDETLDVIASFPCRLFEIPPADFGHGKTRNYGASKGTGDFIVFITQDALPASSTWLHNLVAPMRENDELVGAFGIHYPYPDCNIIDARDITNHFLNFGTETTILYIDDRERYDTDEGYYQISSFFSDNNACIRRSVWEEHPYPDVDFAEDQIWMRKMLEMGFKKAYCPDAPVFHSHNYKLSEYFARCYDEFQALYPLNKGYLIVDRWLHLPKAVARSCKNDVRYVRGLPMTRPEKLKQAHYVIWRNILKYTGGYLGGKSNTLSPEKRAKMDARFSQQRSKKKRRK